MLFLKKKRFFYATSKLFLRLRYSWCFLFLFLIIFLRTHHGVIIQFDITYYIIINMNFFFFWLKYEKVNVKCNSIIIVYKIIKILNYVNIRPNGTYHQIFFFFYEKEPIIRFDVTYHQIWCRNVLFKPIKI